MVQQITDYAGFFANAKQAVQELDELKQREKMLLDLEKQLEGSLKTKKKEVAETISLTVKKRGDELAKSYDTEITKTQDRLKKARSKREKAKSQGEKERIAEETKDLVTQNEILRGQIKTLFHAYRVPQFCTSDLYYALYFPKGIKEIILLLVTLVVCFLAVPVGIYFLIPERKALYLVIIYVLTIVLFGGLYVMVGNSTKMKHMDTLREGRRLRDGIRFNKKQMKRIAKSIRKDQNEAVYNLEKFDDEIAQLEQDVAQAERQKKDALSTFNTVTKTIISDEITGNHKAAIDQMESQNAARAKKLYLTDHFEIYAGKEFMIVDKLSALEEIIQSGKAANLSDAIAVYKSKDHGKKALDQK